MHFPIDWEKDMAGTFLPYFEVPAATDYISMVDSIPVAMCWTVMKRRAGGQETSSGE